MLAHYSIKLANFDHNAPPPHSVDMKITYRFENNEGETNSWLHIHTCCCGHRERDWQKGKNQGPLCSPLSLKFNQFHLLFKTGLHYFNKQHMAHESQIPHSPVLQWTVQKLFTKSLFGYSDRCPHHTDIMALPTTFHFWTGSMKRSFLLLGLPENFQIIPHPLHAVSGFLISG